MADDIIDLTAERNKREAPDPEFVKQDDYGRKIYAFLLEYEMNDNRWSAQLWAYDRDDAAARVAAMRESLTVLGQLFESRPA